MNIHGNARLTPIGREQMVMRLLDGECVETLARSVGVSVRTARKWLARYRCEGVAGLNGRISITSTDHMAASMIKPQSQD